MLGHAVAISLDGGETTDAASVDLCQFFNEEFTAAQKARNVPDGKIGVCGRWERGVVGGVGSGGEG